MANQIDGASAFPPPTSVRKKSFLIFRLLNLYFRAPHFKRLKQPEHLILLPPNVQGGVWSEDCNHVVGIVGMDIVSFVYCIHHGTSGVAR
ncbi:unnamed protein product [Musa textilis]